MQSKNKSLELNPYKDNVRNELIEQIIVWAKRLCKKNIHILSLAGENAFFEISLVKACKKEGITVTGDCIETVWDTYHIMKENLPEGFTPHVGKIEEYIDNKYDVIWLDYCGNPNPERMESFSKVVKNNPVALVYGTFQTDATRYHGGKKQILNELLFGNSPTRSIPTAIRYCIEAKTYGLASEIVLDILYAGGIEQKTGMITVGVQTGKVKIMKEVFADWLTPLRAQRKLNNKVTTPMTDKDRKQAIALQANDELSAKGIITKGKALTKKLDLLAMKIKDSPLWMDDKTFIEHYYRKGLTNNQIHALFENGAVKLMGDWSFHQRVTPTDKRAIAAITNHVRSRMKKERKAA
tara:strand:- start:1987 stop:3042 length:1056 start_codon:yes stop_codon:yes gene_type:complete